MKLCFIADPRPAHTQRWIRWFADAHEVTLIATIADEALAEFQICTLPPASSLRLRLADSVRRVRSAVAKHRPDIVHAHFINEAGWFGALAGQRPFVVTAWGSDIYRVFESKLAGRLNPWAARSADCVTCDSLDQAALLHSWGVESRRISVVGWGVDRSEFNPDVEGTGVRARLDIPPEAPVVLSPRQWFPNSNIESVIAAHSRLPPDTYLILKRIPRYESKRAVGIENAINASDARERIRILGEIDADQLPALYAAADVLVSLCTSDGTPVSVLEAMALGRPVVALDNGSLREWIGEPGGRLVPSLDADVIADSLQAFLGSRAARERAAEHNLAIVARRADRSVEFGRMEKIYQRLALSSPSPTQGQHGD
jgi:glycosyltransferase involved in cell wall biosynthesis